MTDKFPPKDYRIKIRIPENISPSAVKQVTIVYRKSTDSFYYCFACLSEEYDDESVQRLQKKAWGLLHTNPKIAWAYEWITRTYPPDLYTIGVGCDLGQVDVLTCTFSVIDGNDIIPVLSLIFPSDALLSWQRLCCKKVAEYDEQIAYYENNPNVINHQQRVLNEIYNDRRKCYEKRNKRVYWGMHCVATYFMAACYLLGVRQVFMGHTKYWKHSPKMRKRDAAKQQFCYLPHGELMKDISTWCERLRIGYIEVEESYTSKSSAFDNDPLPKYQKGVSYSVKVFSGRRGSKRKGDPRVKKLASGVRVGFGRGTYVCGDNLTVVQADVNASLNMFRKGIPGAVIRRDLMTVEGLEGVVNHPVRIGDYLPSKPKSNKTCNKSGRSGVNNYTSRVVSANTVAATNAQAR